MKSKRFLVGAALLLAAAAMVPKLASVRSPDILRSQVTRPNEAQSRTSTGNQKTGVLRSNSSGFRSALKTGQNDLPTGSQFARRHFPEGKVLATRLEEMAGGEFRRTEIIETSLKYPFVRLETHFRLQGTNEVPINRSEVVADHVVLALQTGATQQQMMDVIRSVEGTLLRKLQVDGAETFLIRLPEPGLDSVPTAIERLAAFTDVVMEVDGDSISRKALVPNDPDFRTLWQFNNTGQEGGSPDSDIDLAEAWSIQTGNRSVLVAVSDTGVDYKHPDLKANIWTNILERVNSSDDDKNSYKDDVRGWNFYHGNNNVNDLDGHGTFVSGIIGAEGNNGIGVAGVAWRCRIIPIRSLATLGGFASDIAEGFDYARKAGAKIINASHGGGDSSVMRSAVDRLQSAGVLLVAAAGNSGEDIDYFPLYPASYPHQNIISVAATTHIDTLAPFSSYGQTSVDLAAPGVEIRSTARMGGYDVYSGTSFSVPQVVGVAALILSQNPAQSAIQVRSRILNSVDQIPELAGRSVTGGRLNAYKALLPRTSFVAALDHEFMQWSSAGDATWTAGNSPFARDGFDAAETGEVWHNGESLLETQVVGPGSISYWWKVSSQPTYDYLAFYVDGVERKRISGKKAWAEETFTFGGGGHTLTWAYRKDGSSTGGDDKGFVDGVIFRGPPPIIFAQPASVSTYAGTAATFAVGVSGAAPFGYQWRKNGINIPGATQSRFEINSVGVANEGNYTVLVRNAGGSVTSAPANLKLCNVSFSAANVSLGHQAASTSVEINTVGTCQWTVTTTNSWISLDSPTVVDSSTVFQFSVSPNDSAYTRLGMITAGNSRFLVKQLGIPAPEELGARVFTMVITNSTDSSITNGSFLLTTQINEGTNTFHLISSNNIVVSNSGSFSYEKTDTSSGYMTLAGTPSAELALSFETGVQGAFAFRQEGSENILYGTFFTRPQGADFNGDPYTDILWQTSQRTLMSWSMRGVELLKTIPLRNRQAVPSGWNVVAPSAFFHPVEMDLVLQNTNRRMAALSLSPGTNYPGLKSLAGQTIIGPGWKAVTSADFNLDGKQDLVFQHLNTRAQVWFMDGTNFLGSHLLRKGIAPGAGWNLVGSADFNSDITPDLLWQHQDGRLQIWNFVGVDFLGGKQLPRAAPDWRAVALGDYNNDGDTDILFQHTNGKLAFWYLNKMAVSKIQLVNKGLPGPTGWRVVGPR